MAASNDREVYRPATCSSTTPLHAPPPAPSRHARQKLPPIYIKYNTGAPGATILYRIGSHSPILFASQSFTTGFLFCLCEPEGLIIVECSGSSALVGAGGRLRASVRGHRVIGSVYRVPGAAGSDSEHRTTHNSAIMGRQKFALCT